MSAGWRGLSTRDRMIVGGAGVAFIAGFLPWWEAAGLGGWIRSGWSAGFTAWAGTLLLTTAGVLLLLRRAGVSWGMTGVGSANLVAAVSAMGLLLVFIRWLSLPHVRGIGFAEGTGYGIHVALLAGVVEVAAAVSEAFASGGPRHSRLGQRSGTTPEQTRG